MKQIKPFAKKRPGPQTKSEQNYEKERSREWNTVAQLHAMQGNLIKVDILWPLTPLRGMRYVLAVIDWCTGWPEMLPLPNALAETCATGVLHHWISKFGMLERITCNKGSKFSVRLWARLGATNTTLTENWTTNYTLKNDNGEHFLCSLKAELKGSKDWLG